jgi:hypothetical protein
MGNEKYAAFEQRFSLRQFQPWLVDRMASIALSVHSDSSCQAAPGYFSLTAASSDETVELDQL